MPSDRTQEARERAEPWEHWADIDCVSCPDCAFTFSDVHRDKDGGYSCPACAEIALDARVSTLETALRPFAEKWDLHAAPYLNDMVDGEEARVLNARTVNEMIEDIKAARSALAEGDNRPKEDR